MAETPKSPARRIREAKPKTALELPAPVAPVAPVAPAIERIPRPRPQPLAGERATIYARNLYLDDLQAIHMVLERHASNILFETEEYRFRLPSQLSEIPQDKIKRIIISAELPVVRIEGRNGHFTLATAGDDQSSRNAYWELWPILHARRSRAIALMEEKPIGFLAVCLATATGCLGILSITINGSFSPLVFILLLVPFFLVMTWPLTLQSWTYRPDVVVSYSKRNAPRPWYASKEMTIAVVSILLTAVASLGVWALTER